jgi:hypothetical protein
MEMNPSKAEDLTSYLDSLADVSKLREIESKLLLPSFDLLDLEVIQTVDWSSPEVTDQLFEMAGISQLPQQSEWRVLIRSLIEVKELSNFVNFYINLTIDILSEALRENYGSEEDIRADWQFYDLLINYKYLDKSAKNSISGYSESVEEMRRARGD